MAELIASLSFTHVAVFLTALIGGAVNGILGYLMGRAFWRHRALVLEDAMARDRMALDGVALRLIACRTDLIALSNRVAALRAAQEGARRQIADSAGGAHG